MPRRHVDRNSEGPYFITSRTINGDWFGIPMERVWELVSIYLHTAKFAFGLEIHAFVLMSNHFHLLVSTPKCNLSGAMAYFLREFSRQLNRDGNRINRTFADRFFPTHIKDYHHFMSVYKYLYQNPVRAGICQRVEEYRFSTIHGLLGYEGLLIPVAEDKILFEGDIQKNLQWLNSPISLSSVESMRKALRRGTFTLPNDDQDRMPNYLETTLI